MEKILEAVNKLIKSYAEFSAMPRYMTYNYIHTIIRISLCRLMCIPAILILFLTMACNNSILKDDIE